MGVYKKVCGVCGVWMKVLILSHLSWTPFSGCVYFLKENFKERKEERDARVSVCIVCRHFRAVDRKGMGFGLAMSFRLIFSFSW